MVNSWHIRGVDPKLRTQAKAQAALENKTMGKWLSDAIDLKLNFEEAASEWARDQGWKESR